MQTALILMTILGCDDSATQCHYIEMVDQRWATIQACDASSEDKLKLYANQPYPVVVAVCQTPEDTGLAELDGAKAEPAAPDQTAAVADAPSGVELPKADIPAPAAAPEADAAAAAGPEPDAGFASRVLARFKQALPEAGTLKSLVAEPVHVVTDSYSWVAKRFD
ncbi:hypothetical protein LL06_15265 [Hoeflea sp. BAL378]|uniref:hypothetical protein n=1 Tax=Hoeflea sp. BAL378 TaxID=1547437 RepID=UPI000512B823|nr:hypothetical protein [Hoeflea sp. BAL378]KGF68727.1 hypothetical protein LL06_15265 [Hoeflea sp. BAL378]